MTKIEYARGLSLRDVEAADQPFLDALYYAGRDDLRKAGGAPAMLAALIRMQQQFQEQGYRAAFPGARRALILREGQPLGRIVINTDPQQGMRLVDIALLPGARSQGIGQAVLRSLQDQAAGCGMEIRLSVGKENHGARRLYHALGFTIEIAGAADDQMVWRA